MSPAEFRELITNKGLEALGRYYSCYRGSVVDNQDPEQLGRIKVKCPQVYDEEVPDYWAWPRGLPAGKDYGLFTIPSVGDNIWVTFEGGDPRYPVWEHGWWSREEVPRQARRNKPTNYVFQTPGGQRLELDDEKKLVRITNTKGRVVEINEGGISLGKEDKSKYSAVLGEEAVSLLKEMLEAIQQLTVNTPVGASTVPINAPGFKAIAEKLDQMLSSIISLE